MKIYVKKNGPYIVEGNYDFFEETITKNIVLDREKSNVFSSNTKIALCRCGQSGNKPFCDGNHIKVKFNGKTTASKIPYIQRSDLQRGPAMSLLDDGRCAFARFCHREHGDVWSLTDQSSNPTLKSEAIEGATACPAGRLTPIEKDKLIEHSYHPEITTVQDPLKHCSAGLFVRGDFELIDDDNTLYEKRNRVSLCRCGESSNKPFCDATHVTIQFSDT